jgi:acetyl esterase/lipase
VTAFSPPVESTTQTSDSDDRWAASVNKGLPYLTADGHEHRVDVYVPEGEGPFPVAVLFGGLLATRRDLAALAAAVADEEMVVFAPTWLIDPTWNPLPEDMMTGFETATCALAFAQQEAAGFRGDPARIAVHGMSAGGQPAAWLALGHRTDLVPGCVSTQPPAPPIGAVLGDSEYFLHSEIFQHGFDSDLEGMQARVRDFVDSSTWPDDLSAVFRIWSAEDATLSREVVDAWDEAGWMAQRDPDGTIRKDLEELGLLDDGEISHIDEATLLADRLQAAGLDATHDIFPGGHEIDDKYPEMIAYLAEITSTG